MAVGKVLTGGQVTVPRKIRDALGIKPGDVLSFRVIGEGKAEMSVVTRLSLAEALERYRITEPVDQAADREVWQRAAAEEAGRSSDG